MRQVFDTARMTELARDSVVEIFTSRSTGTGWIYRVDRNGKAWILTNEHVIRGARTVTVRLSGTGGSRTGTIVGQDEIRDLAVLTICCNSRWEALPTVATNRVDVGSDVAVLGFPGGRIGQDLAVTRGIVSSFGFHDESRSWLIQTDAAINPGNSGGPMLNARGQVVGIVSSRRDPVTAENIGFAISMRTVEQELDYLEVGRTVQASPTPRPTRVPTRVPTVGPSTGASGVLVQDPDDGRIGCATSGFDPTVISDDTIDSAAFLRFEVPNVREWSIGFLYHDPDERSTDAATIIWSDGPGDVYARHWTRLQGEYVHEPPSERIGRNVLKTGSGQWNELSFRTTSRGSYLRLNDEAAIEVPASQLSRRIGWSQLCVGFHSSEDDRYSIRYRDLRTRFGREGASGNLSHSLPDDGMVECPNFTWAYAYIDGSATDSWFVLDFTVPDVENWSFGVLYHDIEGSDSRTYVYRNGYSHYADHTTYEDGDFVDGPREFISSSRLTAGKKVRLEFETTANGSSLYLDSSRVLDVAGGSLTRRIGSVRLCAGLISGETEPYTIRFSDLWAWAE